MYNPVRTAVMVRTAARRESWRYKSLAEWPSANRANYGRLISVPIPGQFMDILRIAEQTAGEALSKKGRPLWGRDALDPPVREAEPLTSPASQNAAVASGHVPPEPAPPMAVRCTATRIRRKLSI